MFWHLKRDVMPTSSHFMNEKDGYERYSLIAGRLQCSLTMCITGSRPFRLALSYKVNVVHWALSLLLTHGEVKWERRAVHAFAHNVTTDTP